LHGAAVAALRYAVMSRPSPSQREPQPPDDPRVFAMLEYERRMRDEVYVQPRYINV